jgi:hypothetical protein
MRSLSSSDFLDLWEQGHSLHPLDQGLLILGTGLPQSSYEELADWPLGRRNRALVELRCASFGPDLQGWISCPRCAEKLEFEVDSRAIAIGPAESEDISEKGVVVNGHLFRLPTTRDLAQAAQASDPAQAAMSIAENCRLDEGEPVWSDEDLEQVGQQMAQADPMAEILINLRCPVCGNESSESLDMAGFFWAEIEARAKRLLFEVHTLASRYGWTEKEVLSLSAQRRAFYMEMVHE